MKPTTLILPTILAFALLTGCGDRLSRYYQSAVNPIPGPVASNTFVTYEDGMAVYHGFPPFPYYILGRYDRPIKLSRLPYSARAHNADFIFLDEHQVDVNVNDPSMVFFTHNMAVPIGGGSHVERRLAGLAYLGTTNSPTK